MKNMNSLVNILNLVNVITTVNMQSKNNLYTHLQHFISILNARNTAA